MAPLAVPHVGLRRPQAPRHESKIRPEEIFPLEVLLQKRQEYGGVAMGTQAIQGNDACARAQCRPRLLPVASHFNDIERSSIKPSEELGKAEMR